METSADNYHFKRKLLNRARRKKHGSSWQDFQAM